MNGRSTVEDLNRNSDREASQGNVRTGVTYLTTVESYPHSRDAFLVVSKRYVPKRP